ncbi:MAG: hypothetical protein LC122_12480 [Chitinophagales bacterium]|nr:hypothetical protein [Chitinophagales bacterium]
MEHLSELKQNFLDKISKLQAYVNYDMATFSGRNIAVPEDLVFFRKSIEELTHQVGDVDLNFFIVTKMMLKLNLQRLKEIDDKLNKKKLFLKSLPLVVLMIEDCNKIISKIKAIKAQQQDFLKTQEEELKSQMSEEEIAQHEAVTNPGIPLKVNPDLLKSKDKFAAILNKSIFYKK